MLYFFVILPILLHFFFGSFTHIVAFFCSFTHIVVTMQYQLLFIIAIVTVQVILQVVWLQLTPGNAEMNYDHSEVTLLQCRYVSYVGPVVAIGELGIHGYDS